MRVLVVLFCFGAVALYLAAGGSSREEPLRAIAAEPEKVEAELVTQIAQATASVPSEPVEPSLRLETYLAEVRAESMDEPKGRGVMIEVLASGRDQGFALLSAKLEALASTEAPKEKRELLELMGELKGIDRDISEFAFRYTLGAVSRNEAPSDPYERFAVPMSALQAFVDHTQSPEEVVRGSVEILGRSTDPAMQRLMWKYILASHPELDGDFRLELERQGVVIPPREQSS